MFGCRTQPFGDGLGAVRADDLGSISCDFAQRLSATVMRDRGDSPSEPEAKENRLLTLQYTVD
jgi:hypothetical protein